MYLGHTSLVLSLSKEVADESLSDVVIERNPLLGFGETETETQKFRWNQNRNRNQNPL